jgi:hypothetical protein
MGAQLQRIGINAATAQIDEAAEIKGKAEKLAAYARIRDDKKSETELSEIKLRAVIRIGELSRELEKAEQAFGGRHPNDGKPTKADQLKTAGISKSSAHRYEELAGPKEKQAQHVVQAATDHYFKKALEEQKPAARQRPNFNQHFG